MKRILVIDDDVFYLHLIEKFLKKLQFHTVTADNPSDAIQILQKESFDIIISDLNFGKENAEPFIQTVKKELQLTTPLIILSGSSNHEIIEKILHLGATDYITKPVTLKNLGLKIYKTLNLEIDELLYKIHYTLINEKRIGVVIPCYNEEERLESDEFRKLVLNNSSYHICFVNDGSKDNTLGVLQEIQSTDINKISVLDMEKNAGKAEAVRRGILYLMNEKPLDYIGFLDADLSTDFKDYDALSKLIQTEDYDMIIGSRLSRVGAEINKESKRSIISYLINKIIVSIIKTPVRDTQCGAKIFTIETAKILFKTPFQSRWLFDVELFIRLKKWKHSQHKNPNILEYPLKRWIHKDGSKLGFKDSMKIFFELQKIKSFYKKN